MSIKVREEVPSYTCTGVHHPGQETTGRSDVEGKLGGSL